MGNPDTDFVLQSAGAEHDKLHLRKHLRPFQDYVDILRIAQVSGIDDRELRSVDAEFLKQRIIFLSDRLYRVSIHPVVDNLNLLLRYTFSHDVFLEGLSDDDNSVSIPVSIILNYTANLPK